jgi:hypothetical protein
MKGHYETILKQTEKNLESMLVNLVTDENSCDYGGIVNYTEKLLHPGHAVDSLLTAVSLYLNKESKYYLSEDLYKKILIILDYIKRIQRPDGTFDLLVSNFYSSPDTGFIGQNLAYTYKIIEKYGTDEKSEKLTSELFDIIKKSGYAMVTGGFHTPNHRWVIASALFMYYSITKEESFKEMAQRYLNEGIDCDENGEYTERSSGIYNVTNNNSLIILSQEMKREDLLEHVKRNLDMMLTYIEPDWSIYTQNSTRQDKGEGSQPQIFYPTPYYYIYLYMAYKFKNGKYAAIADYIFRNSIIWSNSYPNTLHLYMLKDELKDFEIEKLPIPQNYHKYYEKSGIVRVRKGNTSYTILKDSSSFLFFQKGDIRFHMKICASFFSKAQFKAQNISEIPNGYKLTFKTQGWYRMPFEEPPATSNWREMDHNKREMVNILDLIFHVYITEIEEGLKVRVVTEGCDRVPVKLEFCFTPNCIVSGESFDLTGEPGQSIVIKSGYVEVRKGTNIINIGPGFGKHNYASEMRGSEFRSKSEYTVYFTDYTNIDRTVYIK